MCVRVCVCVCVCEREREREGGRERVGRDSVKNSENQHEKERGTEMTPSLEFV